MSASHAGLTAPLVPASFSAIRVRNIAKRFGHQPILQDIALDISAGEIVVVLGPSGSGKTTLLRIIAGLEIPDRGEVYLHGAAATLLPPQQRGLGVVFQEHALFQRKTVEENIAFGLRMQGKSKDECQNTVNRLLALTQLEAHRRKYPAYLSGGQRQRVALARAMIRNPEILILDEATSAIDAQSEVLIHTALKSFVKGRTTFIITHSVTPSVLELVSRIVVMEHGRIIATGSHEQLLANCPQYGRLYQSQTAVRAA